MADRKLLRELIAVVVIKLIFLYILWSGFMEPLSIDISPEGMNDQFHTPFNAARNQGEIHAN